MSKPRMMTNVIKISMLQLVDYDVRWTESLNRLAVSLSVLMIVNEDSVPNTIIIQMSN